MAPGEYWTAINVHNPSDDAVRFRKRIAVALPNEKAGPVTGFFQARLGPGEALEIDRGDIVEHMGGEDRFLKGFVVIECKVELNVVAVYTAAGATGMIETLHIERVPAAVSVVEELPDLVPVPDSQGSFCKGEGGKLAVTVRNQGAGPAGPSVTRVDFGALGQFTQPTPPLAPGASVDLFFEMPQGCFQPDCTFRITVDANNQVVESNEGNNSASGVCVG
ncbi:MAG TPA: CARDB domain-containing protein [Chloroflexia bacterium]